MQDQIIFYLIRSFELILFLRKRILGFKAECVQFYL